MLFGPRSTQPRPGLTPEDAAYSAGLATRRSQAAPRPVPTPAEAEAASRALMRIPYDEAIASGAITALPQDLTGATIGEIVVEGPAEAPDTWTLMNPNARAGAAHRYAVSTETLMASYAHGELLLPVAR